MIQLYFEREDIKTLIRVLDYVVKAEQAEPIDGSAIRHVDHLCRRESINRWRRIRVYLNNRLPKTQRI